MRFVDVFKQLISELIGVQERKAISLRTSKLASTPSPHEPNKKKIKEKEKERTSSFSSFDPSVVEYGKLLSLIPGSFIESLLLLLDNLFFKKKKEGAVLWCTLAL